MDCYFCLAQSVTKLPHGHPICFNCAINFGFKIIEKKELKSEKESAQPVKKAS